jgi:hypothetical protein
MRFSSRIIFQWVAYLDIWIYWVSKQSSYENGEYDKFSKEITMLNSYL